MPDDMLDVTPSIPGLIEFFASARQVLNGVGAYLVLALIGLATLALVKVRPLRPLVAPYVLSVAVSTAIYLFPPGIDGREDFYPRLAISAAGALLISTPVAMKKMKTSGAWAIPIFGLLGAITPLVMFLVVLLATCTSGSCVD